MAQLPRNVNPPEGMNYDSFPLNGGLDLTSPKIAVEKGTLLDCSNRETVDRIGYKTIDGIDRYDGRTPSTQTEFYYISADSYGGTLATDFAVGVLLVVEGATSTVFGKSVGTATISSKPSIIYARINEDAEPSTSDVVDVYGGSLSAFTVAVGPTRWSAQTSEDAQEVVSSYNTYNASLRTTGSTPIEGLDDIPIGLHWYRDRLYAVRDDATIYFTQVSGQTAEIFPNSLLSKDAGASTARVLSIQLTSGTWATEDASGLMQIEILTGTWGTSGTVSVTAPTVATTFTLRAATSSDPEIEYASIWQSKSEQQAIDEDAGISTVGWNRIDHGWFFDVENGYSSTGDLVKVSRGTTNNFSYTTSSVANNDPTDVYNGNNVQGLAFAPSSRSPLALLVSDGNPGWKTTASAAAFASDSALASAIDTADSVKAYANFWYSYTAQLGQTMYARDKDINGPANVGAYGTIITGGNAVPNVGAVTLDSDWFSTQIRSPIILKDFSAAMASVPAGSLITGVAVSVAYATRHFAAGEFQASRITNTTFRDDIISVVNGALVWEAGVVNITSGTASELLGSVASANVAIETDTADYTLATSTSGGRDGHFMAQTADLTGQTATIGGSGNTLGLGATDRDYWLDTSKGICVVGNITSAPQFPSGMIAYVPSGTTSVSEIIEGQVRCIVDTIKVTFYYTTPSARYYVGDGSGNVCSVDVFYTLTRDGTWESRTAEAEVQATNLRPDLEGTKRTVVDGDKLFLTQADALANTNSIADVATDADYNGLPARNLLISNASRYQFITANFFGRDEWDGFYGVSGAGRAFSFATFDADGVTGNESYIARISTSTLDETGDTPRHIAFHHYSLALGFRSGIVRFSVLGEPENFDGVDGAAEVGVGDKVTGLLSMRGETLGVFCENSIWGIAGTDADNYQTQVLAPYTGAIEYTVVDMGLPVYCDSRGISTLDQSEKYGNFLGQRLSARVTPFILPRMLRNNAQFSGKGVVCAIPVRAKNQYRLFFKDGECLVMTMNPDSGPSFTFSNYYIGQSALTDTQYFVVPFAWSSQVDEKGVERIHFSHYSPLSSITTANSNYVYEMDRGWSFAGNFIPAEYTLNWFFRDPFTYSTIRKFRIDGLTNGFSSCTVYCAKDYDSTFSTNGADISLPINPLSSYSVDMVPATSMSNIAERGRSLSLKVKNVIPTGDSITDPIPPDIHQIALVQFTPGGKEDA